LVFSEIPIASWKWPVRNHPISLLKIYVHMAIADIMEQKLIYFFAGYFAEAGREKTLTVCGDLSPALVTAILSVSKKMAPPPLNPLSSKHG
jgi:hypothetical protein